MNTILLKPDQVAEALPIGKTKTYALIANRQIPSIRIGGKRARPDRIAAALDRRAHQGGCDVRLVAGSCICRKSPPVHGPNKRKNTNDRSE
jgi:excisionase family DNA binding protein